MQFLAKDKPLNAEIHFQLKKILLFSFLLLTIWLVDCKAQSNEHYYFSNLSLKDGLSQISIVKILQDTKGFMWFGSRNGLNRYDGANFTVYKHNPADSTSLTDSHITSLVEDNNGNLWVGTIKGLNKINLKTNQNTQYPDNKRGLSGHSIRSLFIDSKKRLWVGTPKGLCLYIEKQDKFQPKTITGLVKEAINVICETKDHKLIIGTSNGFFICDLNLNVLKYFNKNIIDSSLKDNNVSSIYEDSKNQLWIGYTQSGIAKINLQDNQVLSFTKENSKLSNNYIRCFAEQNGTLFIGTFDGLYAIDVSTNIMVKHANVNTEEGYLSHFSIYSLYADHSGTVWVGSYSGGVNYFSKYSNRFKFHDQANILNSMFGIFGAMVCKTPDNLYIATEGGGLLEYNLKSNSYKSYPIPGKQQLEYNQNIIKSVMLEGETLWYGTNKGGLYQFNTRSKKTVKFITLAKQISIYAIYKDSNGNLRLGTSNPKSGILTITKDKKIQNEFDLAGSKDKLKMPSSRCMMEIHKGVFLIGTRSFGLLKYDENNKTLERYSFEEQGAHKVLSNYITCILRDSKQQIWIGTFGGGIFLYDEHRGVLKSITTKQGLISNDVCAVVEDNRQQLWISTSNAVSKYNPSEKKISNYNQFGGIGVQEFSPHSGILLPDGQICFSGNNGFVTFNPLDLQPNPFKPAVVFTGLTINNQLIEPGKSNLLKYIIDDTRKIKLAYDQNNLSISYCALNYIFPDQNQYAYRLVGHDKEWNYVGNRKEVFYTNLNPGKYNFEAKASNNDGVWNDVPRTIQIVISPPIWKTWYAYLFYILLFLSIFGLIIYYISTKQQLEQELKFKQMEKLQLEEFHQTKIRMFTNFSHELRTPLTLIIAPLQELFNMPDISKHIKNKLGLISSNAQRLLLLVNQIMDIRKSQSGKMQLKLSKDNICSFAEEMYYAFNQIAINKHIKFSFINEEDTIEAWFDKSLFEKVVFNLLSNAFKYTRENGEIVLSLKQVQLSSLKQEQLDDLKNNSPEATYVCLSVSDTGKGIPAAEIRNIFTPFYQIDQEDKSDTIGTGIGLSLTKSVVQLHRGTVWVEDHEPTGSVFKVVIPINKSVYNNDMVEVDTTNSKITDVLLPSGPMEVLNLEKKHTVLLVEDNDDVRDYVRERLDPYFFILEANNGLDAFNIAIDKYPDLIISDVMMPKMNGIELCSNVKKDLLIGHIPIILITAKSMVAHIKEGFSVGADDYIVKPFNMDVLIYRVINLLDSSERLKKIYGKRFSTDSLGIEIISRDDRFTQKFFEVIEKNISNSELSIDLLSSEIGISRANLYRKLKAITELSATEVIRNKRLEVAAKLLAESDLTVSEVSTHVGFNSHTYFTTSFKALYGCPPTEFVQKHKKTEPSPSMHVHQN